MFTITNLGLSIQNGFCWIISASLILTFITFIHTNLKDTSLREIKKKEEKLSFGKSIELYVNRVLHHISTICIIGLPYIFKPELWLYILYEMYLLIAGYSWYLLKECPLTIHEKQILDPKYRNGSTNLNPFMELLVPYNVYILIFRIMYVINFGLISYILYEYYKNV